MVRNSDVLIADLVGELEPVKPLRFATGMAYALIAGALPALLVIARFGPRPDLLAGALNPFHLVATGLALGLALAASVTVIVMSRPCVGTDHNGWTWAAAMAALVPAAGLIAGLSSSSAVLSQDSIMHGAACFGVSGVASLLVFGVLVWWLRKGAPTAPDRAGLVAGIAAGSFGAFAILLHCSDNEIVHVGIWHSAVMLAMGGLGRVIVPSLVRW